MIPPSPATRSQRAQPPAPARRVPDQIETRPHQSSRMVRSSSISDACDLVVRKSLAISPSGCCKMTHYEIFPLSSGAGRCDLCNVHQHASTTQNIPEGFWVSIKPLAVFASSDGVEICFRLSAAIIALTYGIPAPVRHRGLAISVTYANGRSRFASIGSWVLCRLESEGGNTCLALPAADALVRADRFAMRDG